MYLPPKYLINVNEIYEIKNKQGEKRKEKIISLYFKIYIM